MAFLKSETRTEAGQEVAILLEKAIIDIETACKSLSKVIERVGGLLKGGGGIYH